MELRPAGSARSLFFSAKHFLPDSSLPALHQYQNVIGLSHFDSRQIHIQSVFFIFICLIFHRLLVCFSYCRASEQERSLADESLASMITSKMLNSTQHFTWQFFHEFLIPPFFTPLSAIIFSPKAIVLSGVLF